MHPLLRFAKSHLAEVEAAIQGLVECESPSDSPAAVNRCVDLLVAESRDIARPKIIRVPGGGNHLLLEFNVGTRQKQGRILGLGHSDTVWPLGTIAQMPFRKAKGRLYGPGVLDMKTGLVLFLYAVRALRERESPVGRQLSLLIVSDEETGSLSSRALTEAEASRSTAVLVLEPGTGLTGKLKTARKGIGNYRIHVDGRASHAGVDFEQGASAVVEASHQVLRCAALTDLARGTTVNPGVIQGGSRSNVIAAEAHIEVDLRVVRMSEARRLDKQLRALRPIDKRCRLTVEGGLNRPPMERTAGIAALFEKAQRLGADLGLSLEESATGGGSDGNFTAALGIPTLDGLGAVGEGAHASHESVLLQPLAGRIALLASLLETI